MKKVILGSLVVVSAVAAFAFNAKPAQFDTVYYFVDNSGTATPTDNPPPTTDPQNCPNLGSTVCTDFYSSYTFDSGLGKYIPVGAIQGTTTKLP